MVKEAQVRKPAGTGQTQRPSDRQTAGALDDDPAVIQAALEAYFAELAPDRASEARALDVLFRDVTGFAPRLWRGNILGYGRYDYRYESGRSGTCLATGFAVRKAELSIYIMPGYADFLAILERLGPHRKGKSCLYIRRLERIELPVLAELIEAGLKDLEQHWPVSAR